MAWFNGYKRKNVVKRGGESHNDACDEKQIPVLPLHSSSENTTSTSHNSSPSKYHSRKQRSFIQQFAFSVVSTAIFLLSKPKVQIGLSIAGLLSLPLAVFSWHIFWAPGGFFQACINVWDSFLHMTLSLVASTTFIAACLSIYLETKVQKTTTAIIKDHQKKDQNPPQNITKRKVIAVAAKPPVHALAVIVLFLILSSYTSIQQLVNPGWIWMPFLFFKYKVYWPSDLGEAIQGVCPDYKVEDQKLLGRDPLCLSESSWKTLSAGALSSENPEDVQFVLKGLEFLQKDSSGLVVNVLGRDVADHIQQLRDNIEALSLLVPKLSVVVFENDSVDGSREAFQAWAKEPNKKYQIDLMECPEAENCKLNRYHRYDGMEDKDFFTAPAVGEMHVYRQRILDYIVANPEYHTYSHMMQIDLDIGISISPLGVIHTLGKAEDNIAVASSCRQPWAGGLGTLIPPYDFNSFQALRTTENERLFSFLDWFCDLMPPNDKWRFNCVGASSVQFLQIIQLDRANDDLYPVASAYNGAALYPLQLIRKNNPKYYAGEYGQICEHIAFNMGVDKKVYVNPKWECHMSPALPGGPKGERAMRSVRRFGAIPRVAIPLFLQTAVPLVISVFSTMTLWVHVLRQITSRLFRSPRRFRRSMFHL